jgi:large subunit ribosomal protein L6
MVSRIARKPIVIPSGVNATIANHQLLVKGKLGQLSEQVPLGINAIVENGSLRFEPAEPLTINKKVHISVGTTHALAKNMIIGVSEGFTRTLVLVGVGYRAEVKGERLNLVVGYSHSVEILIPKDITVKVEKSTLIVLSGIDKQRVSQFSAKIRAVRAPEPYKGKGIRYQDEKIKKKEVKKK